MKSSQFWTAASRVLAAATVTLMVTLLLAPGAWAASKYKIRYKFTGGTDGGNPQESVILDTAGDLFGTTTAGGTYGSGTVFELTPNSDGTWTESVLYSFTGGSDGADPLGGLIFDTVGNLYSTTGSGGAHGYGTVFELTPNSDGTWTESVLYSFTGGSDGSNPWDGVIFDAAGSLYGETAEGGGSTRCKGGCGVVFKLTPNSGGGWTESVLHRFTGQDGSDPIYGSLIFDAAGNLYGGTFSGYTGGPCCGTIFELTPNQDGSWKEKVLHRFTGGKDGANPSGALIFDPYGNLYGTTSNGGDGYGLVFRLKLGAKGNWTEHVLHAFQGNQDGAYSDSGVVLESGNLYGTTFYGEDAHGNCCTGQVYELVRHAHGRWTKRVVHYFEGGKDGSNTAAGVVFDTAGNLYGATWDGGPNDAGVVFEIIK